ncbi:MAG: hypothetical protein ABSA49_14740, partial [Rhizomicrobium sp.]
RTHWLSDVRNEAAKVVSELQTLNSAISRPTASDGTLGYPPQISFEVDATNAPDVAPCESGRWTWKGREFGDPGETSKTLHIDASGGLRAGNLIGRDSGEWGGEVKWESAPAKPLFVVYGNVEGIQPSRDGAVAVIGSGGTYTTYDEEVESRSDPSVKSVTVDNGPGGSGYAVELRRDASGAWRVKEIARFPRAAFDLKSIGQDLFVAWSGNRAIIFTPSGIAGVAQCVVTK